MNRQRTVNAPTFHTPIHRVIADGIVLYEGDEWASVLLEAGFNPAFREIILIGPDGKPGAHLHPSLAPEALRDRCHPHEVQRSVMDSS